MPKPTLPLTLLEFVKVTCPDNWAKYAEEAGKLMAKPGHSKALVAHALAQQFFPGTREANAKAHSEYAAIVKLLKDVLPQYVVVGDDIHHKATVLERRHWADATFELENSALWQGDQRWTNVEVRSPSPRALSSAHRTGMLPATKMGAKKMDDAKYVDELLRLRVKHPTMSVHAFVSKRETVIPGANLMAKVRRLQKRLRDIARHISRD
jgi:hypothetical protein